MPSTDLAKQADAVRADLARLEADLRTLLAAVGGVIGATISGRVGEPVQAIRSHLDPLLSLLGAETAPATAAKRALGWPPKTAAAPSPKPRRKRRGGRGKKANLTPEVIQAALKTSKGNKSAAARALGVSLPTLYKYMGATAAPAEKGRPVKKTEKRA